MPSHDAAVECQYLGFQRHQLGAKRGNARARHFRQPGVLDIGNDFQQLLDAPASNRRYDPKLCKAGADRVDNRRLLPDEQMPRAVQRQTALLLGRLGRHEPHVRSGDRFADRFRIGSIVLLSLDIRLHIGRRHQANGVAEGLKLPRPMMG